MWGQVPTSRKGRVLTTTQHSRLSALDDLMTPIRSVLDHKCSTSSISEQPYCLELTHKGWRITSLRSDCMIGDFTRLELFTRYYDSLYSLMDTISPGYRERFSEKLALRLKMLEVRNKSGLTYVYLQCSRRRLRLAVACTPSQGSLSVSVLDKMLSIPL